MTPSTKTSITFRTDAKLKADATKVLASLHLDVTTACNLFLEQVVKQNRLPFVVTNESETDRELRQLRVAVEQGILQAEAGEGIAARDYLKTVRNQLINKDRQ